MAISLGNATNTATTKTPEIAVKCKTLESVPETFFSFAAALSPATEGIKIEERDVKNEDGKNKIGKTIPFIMPYRLIAVSAENPYIRSLAGIIVFSTVLNIAFKYEVAESGNDIPRILKIMLSALTLDRLNGFFSNM